MNDIDCPDESCSFVGTIPMVTTHVEETADESHQWERLGFENSNEFSREAHVEVGTRNENTACDLRDLGEYEESIRAFEQALWHYQRAQLVGDGDSSIGERIEIVLDSISQVEDVDQVKLVEDLVIEAENAEGAGDQFYLDGDSTSAENKYDEACDLLTEAITLASEIVPDRVEEIERQRRRVKLRRASLDLSDSHHTIRDLLTTARENAAEGDYAFHASDYETALTKYKQAKDCYESLADVYDELSFDTSTSNPTECDICGHRFDEDFEFWRIDVLESLQVCPSCARFGTDGNLPRPREVANEHRAVAENIKGIQDSDVGLDWTSHDTTTEGDSADTVPSQSRDTREMLIQLVSLYQQRGRQPNPEELDANTDFGYQAYLAEFDSIPAALEAAGFEP